MLDWIKKEKKIFAWIPAMLWGACILIFTILPYCMTPNLTAGSFDKMTHFFEYAILGVVLVYGMRRTSPGYTFRNLMRVAK